MVLEQLTNVHTGRNTQGVQHNVDRGAVGQVRHILYRQNAGDNTLVTMTTGELVALLDLTLLSNEYANEFVYTRSKFVSVCAGRTDHVDYAATGSMEP